MPKKDVNHFSGLIFRLQKSFALGLEGKAAGRPDSDVIIEYLYNIWWTLYDKGVKKKQEED